MTTKTLRHTLLALPLAALLASAEKPVPATASLPAVNNNTAAAAADPASAQPALPLGPEDLVSLLVADAPELTRNFRIATNGTLALPLLNKRIKAAGLLPVELETAIAEQLAREEVLVKPVVSVAVAEYRSRPVSVAGAVRHPIQFQAVGEVTLLDALTKADGLSPEAGPEILVSRKTRDAATGAVHLETQRIPVKGLIDLADSALNLPLQGNEEIRVPEAGKFYIAGNVKKPGAFPMPDNGDSTVLKSVALAEGLLPYTAKLAYIYRRNPGAAARTEIPVELHAILHRKSPDVAMMPDDILYIPDNSGKKLTANVLERIASFGATTASGVLVWGAR